MRRFICLNLLLLLLTSLVFFRVPFFDFVLIEDTTQLDTNPYLSPISKENLSNLWKRPHVMYMPLTYSLWSLTTQFSKNRPINQLPQTATGVPKQFRFDPLIFHLLPFLFHLAMVILLFWLFCFLTSDPIGSFFGSLIFAIHPVQVESVAWVSSLKEPLGGFLGVLALGLFLLSEEYPPRSKTFRLLFFFSTLSFLMSLFSNPASISFPLMGFVLLVFLYRKERFQHGIKTLSFWLFLTLPVIALQHSGPSWAQTPSSNLNFQQKVILGLDSLSFYFGKLVMPFNLGIDYGRTPYWVFNHTSIHTTAILFFIFILALTLFLRWNRLNWALASEGLVLSALLPIFLFNRLLFQTSSSVADRDLYLAMIGIGLAVAYLTRLWMHKPLIKIALISYLVVIGTQSYFQTLNWANSKRLLTVALEINSQSAIAHHALGYWNEREENYPKAIEHYVAAGKLDPRLSDFTRLANIYLCLKQFNQAKLYFEKALGFNPLSAYAHQGLGLSYLGLGNKILARDSFAKANALAPNLKMAENALRQIQRSIKTAKSSHN